MTRYRLATEIFSLPHGRDHLVYAPLLQTSVVVNDTALNLLADIAAERAVSRNARTREVLDLLAELQLIGKAFDEATVLRVGRAVETAANFTAKPQAWWRSA